MTLTAQSFWGNYEKGSSQKSKYQKADIVRPGDLMEIVKPIDVFNDESWTKTRFFGPMFGLSILNVPIIRQEKFFKKDSRYICIPKQLLGYNFQTGQLDESKCPYLKYLTLDNSLLAIATVNYLKESNVKDKETLITSIENDGLRKTYYNKELRKIITSSRDLSQILINIASKGAKEFYSNVYIKKSLKAEEKERFKNLDVRKSSEKKPVTDTLGYSALYNLPVYFAESKESVLNTPLRVMRFTEANIGNLVNKVFKLNSISVEDPDGSERDEIKAIEDPEFGCEVQIMLQQSQLQSFSGSGKIMIPDFAKGDRAPLTEEQKTWLMWDLSKIKTKETYDEAMTFLQELGYTNHVEMSHASDVPFEKPYEAPVKKPVVVEEPAVIVDTPKKAVFTEVETSEEDSPFDIPVVETSDADFDNLFN